MFLLFGLLYEYTLGNVYVRTLARKVSQILMTKVFE